MSRTANTDLTHYAILCVNKGVSYFAERSLEDACSRNQTIMDIAAGNVEGVAKVFAFNPAEHIADDVTEGIAVEIACRCSPGEPISPELRDFIERAAGLEFARGLRVLDRAFA